MLEDLRKTFDPSLTAEINGHVFRVEPPTAREGLILRSKFLDVEKVKQLNELEEINRLFRGELDENGIPFGGLWDELDAAGVGVEEAIHFGMTAVYYWGVGADFAIEHWQSLGKAQAALQKALEEKQNESS